MYIIVYYQLYRWWNKCVAEINYGLCLEHDRQRIMRKALMPWFR